MEAVSSLSTFFLRALNFNISSRVEKSAEIPMLVTGDWGRLLLGQENSPCAGSRGMLEQKLPENLFIFLALSFSAGD